MFARRVRSGAMMVPLAVMMAACSEPITGPQAAPDGLSSTFIDTEVSICKRGGEIGKQYPFTLTATGGSGYTLPLGTNLNIVSTVDNCFVMFFPGDGTTTLTLTETGGYMPSKIEVEWDGVVRDKVDTYTGTNTVTVQASRDQGYTIFVYNDEVPPPPPPPPPPGGGEGCTPGYWKQSQHFGSWTAPYSPGSSTFNAAFGVNLFSNSTTMLTALGTGGGGMYRLGRHATAALLNTAAGISYGKTTADVIAMVQAAVASGNYDAASDVLEGLNEKGCPLGLAPLDETTSTPGKGKGKSK